MLNQKNILETIEMIDKQHLDVRTITMGISLRDCAHPDAETCCGRIYDKICKKAENLVKTGEDIEGEFGIPIVNKRIAVTPIAMVAESCETEDYVPFARALDRAAGSTVEISCSLHIEEGEAAVFLCSGGEDPVVLLSESGDYASTIEVGGRSTYIGVWGEEANGSVSIQID